MRLGEVVRNLGNMETILRTDQEEPEINIRVIVREHDLLRSTMYRVFKEESLHSFPLYSCAIFTTRRLSAKKETLWKFFENG